MYGQSHNNDIVLLGCQVIDHTSFERKLHFFMAVDQRSVTFKSINMIHVAIRFLTLVIQKGSWL